MVAAFFSLPFLSFLLLPTGHGYSLFACPCDWTRLVFCGMTQAYKVRTSKMVCRESGLLVWTGGVTMLQVVVFVRLLSGLASF
jgi:hypothetical protein